MLKLFYFLSLSLWGSIGFSMDKIVVISDLDDTIRQVNVSEMDEAIAIVSAERSGLKKIAKFDGLFRLYKDLNKEHQTDFYYLSASYPFIYNAKNWLEQNDFPAGEVLQRKSGDEFNSGIFKKRILKSIIDKYKNNLQEATFLFFGDNGEHDPESYKYIVDKTNISDNSYIFIRDVVTDAHFIYADSRAPLDGINYFLSEKQLLSTPLIDYISTNTYDYLAKLTISNIPLFMIDNLDERYEDNICDKIPYYKVRKKLKCILKSGTIARKMINGFLDNL